MLSRNLVIASMAVVLLASTVSTAPVEDKEPEESDFEAEEGEEELSEEEEDDDDSKGQHMKGAGSHQATAAPKGSGSTAASSVVGESPNGQKPNGGTHSGQVSSSSTASNDANGSHGRDGHSRPSDSSSHGASYGGQEGSKSEIARPGGTGGSGANAGLGSKVPGADGAVHSVSISVAGEGSPGQMSAGRPSAGQTLLLSSESQSQHEGSEAITSHADGSLYESEEPTHDGSQIEPPEIPDVESNGNGHKHLLNGGELGFTGFDHFLTSSSQTDGAGIIDQSSHDFLVGLMGGMGESAGSDTHTDGLGSFLDLIDSPPDVPPTCLVTDAISADHAFQLDSTAGGQSPGKPSLDGSVLDITTELDHLSIDNGNGDSTDPIDTSYNGFYSTTDPADNGSDNGADSSDTNGNGRHKPVADIQKGEASSTSTFPHGDQYTASSHPDTVGSLDTSVHTVSPFADPTGVDGITGGSAQTDMAGALAGLVTGGQTDQTGHGQLAVTDGMPNYTDSGLAAGTGFTDASQTHSVILQTDLSVTDDPYAVSSQTDVAGTALGEAQATLGDSSRPAATEQTQTAVSAGEQYHTSGQGPEGAENVELEDTC